MGMWRICPSPTGAGAQHILLPSLPLTTAHVWSFSRTITTFVSVSLPLTSLHLHSMIFSMFRNVSAFFRIQDSALNDRMLQVVAWAYAFYTRYNHVELNLRPAIKPHANT